MNELKVTIKMLYGADSIPYTIIKIINDSGEEETFFSAYKASKVKDGTYIIKRIEE